MESAIIMLQFVPGELQGLQKDEEPQTLNYFNIAEERDAQEDVLSENPRRRRSFQARSQHASFLNDQYYCLALVVSNFCFGQFVQDFMIIDFISGLTFL